MSYRVSAANQYLVITGAGISDVRLRKKSWVWPFQKARFFDITPTNYTLNLQAMSAEKLEFMLPAVFTIGPRDEPSSLKRFAKLLANSDKEGEQVTELVRGIIEGETRVIAASMTMEEIFKESKRFKDDVFTKVQTELDQFGLHIYNANIKQLMDAAGSEYFLYMRMKTHEGAVNQAKVDVAEAKYIGNVGEKKREGLTRQNVARVDAETLIYENERKAEMANAASQLQVREAEYNQNAKIAKIEAMRKAEMRDAELSREVEERRALAQTERLRADLVAKATADYEVAVQAANAELFAKQKEAEAALYAKQKEAEGMRLLYAAQAEGVQKLAEAFGGNMAAFRDYLMIDRGVYQQMARINADAVRGLEPKITVWNTGSNGGDGKGASAGAMQPIADVFRTLPPLFTTINEQTGVVPFPWMASVPNAGKQAATTSQ
ncbi:hypothetical protein THASP1DRAFT_14201 [Thamnocephalis sphaerospora]|uniref:Band 7 domain-containing protein n=1 Tax=Thamnocephalis sphaerospora TaxID=78915 RepID=A0A4P9XVM8_9FUNG|nr:hypothetical protein THASP1DRAFT_14201 [Thamnocephalis sphaerospora]|eukprot:RKP09470.1 hypothetical protein THASP1DRAFT_14201 [Thamnocephalis sphaerospora]